VALVRTDVLEEGIAPNIRVNRIRELGTTLAVTSYVVTVNVVPSSLVLDTLMMQAIRSSETSVLTRAIRRHIPEDGMFHSHRRETFKSYIALTGWAL
jgi:hypothetical protein